MTRCAELPAFCFSGVLPESSGLELVSEGQPDKQIDVVFLS